MDGILVANRGEIALRIVRAAAELGLRTVAVHTRDDADSPHTRRADEVRALPGEGAAGYLDADAVLAAGDGTGAVTHFWDRDCSVQRRHQKLIEIAPALPAGVREALLDAALRMAARVRYEGLGTFEFLVVGDEHWFLEVNPRLQVEHTVTEEITGVDLVQTQIRLALGEGLEDLGLASPRPPVAGCAVQVRVNTETIGADGTPHPRAGTLTAFAPPAGPGVRVDTYGRAGYRTSPRYDPLLAKVIARAGDLPSAAARAHGALGEFEIAGVPTSIPLLRGVLRHPGFTSGGFDMSFIAEHLPGLLEHQHAGGAAETVAPDAPPGTVAVPAPMQGTVVSVDVADGDLVRAGTPVAVLEAMKMEHVVHAGEAGVVRGRAAVPGDTVVEDEAGAVDAARRYLSYFQRPRDGWECDDQRILRHVVPENRLRAYDVRRAVAHLADTGSVLELRRAFGVGIVTALVRIEGRPMGLIASNPAHLGGRWITTALAGAPPLADRPRPWIDTW